MRGKALPGAAAFVLLATSVLGAARPGMADPVGQVTEFSTGITAHSNPGGITAGPDGSLWFTENNGIGRITPSGTVTEFTVPTANGPVGITAGPDGNLWFTEHPDRIGRITPSGTVTEFSTGITANSYPANITAGPDGNLWFTENGGNQIGRITTSGTVTEFSTGITANSGPLGITAGPDGNLWFTEDNGNQIGRITTSGSVTEFSSGITASNPAAITAGPDGNLWFAEGGNRIGRITTSGSVTEFSTGITANGVPGTCTYCGPNWITAGPDGNLWFTHYGGNLVGRMTTSGTVTEFSTGITANSDPDGITAGPDGNLWFTELTGNRVAKIGSGAAAPRATMTSPVVCEQAGRMESDSSLHYDLWNLRYGISKCEGLVVSQVKLGDRLMAERMSLPYLNVDTCSGSDTANCHATVRRHITLRRNADEAQPDSGVYTHVRLISQHGEWTSVNGVGSPPGECQLDKGTKLCEHIAVSATYRADFAPSSAGAAQNYLLITQRYEFYKDFPEQGMHELACEPSKDTGFSAGLGLSGWLAAPLDDCGRWKPLVTYNYKPGSSGQVLVKVNAAARLHFTPDATAVRASALLRDCDPAQPKDTCKDALGHLDEYNGETALQHEGIVRAFSDSPAGITAGRYDNIHQTPANEVVKPGLNFTPLPHVAAGCPECVHMHWRWGQDILDGRVSHYFGDGKPLVSDSEPAALPAPPRTHQQLDVAVVAYHSEELAPLDYSQLVVPGMQENALNAALNVNVVNGKYQGGSIQGARTLEYPSGSCSVPNNPATWGQCGEVTWLSATALNDQANHEKSDTFFAFGGFFCAKCGSDNYSAFAASSQPHYRQTVNGTDTTTLKAAKTFAVLFVILRPNVQIWDALPAGSTNATGTIVYVSKPGFFTGPSVKTAPCSVGASPVGGSPVVHCSIPDDIWLGKVGIQATAPGQQGSTTNAAHAMWGDASSNSDTGGNSKTIDDLTIAP